MIQKALLLVSLSTDTHQILYNSAQLFQVGCPLKLCHVKYNLFFGPIIYCTSLKVDLHQDINRDFTFSSLP